jgi:hypothetical protein
MTNSTRESLTIPLAPPERNSLPDKGSRFGPLFVRECVPAGAGFTRVTRLHTGCVNRTQEALALPWIRKLPGEKHVRYIDGQVFVIQKYAGCQLIRAHICHDEERRGLDLGDLDCTSKAEHEMSFEHVA